MIAIVKELGRNEEIEILRDRDCLGVTHDNVVKFMEEAGKTGKVLFVFSDKFLRSPNCMFELCLAVDSLWDKSAEWWNVFFFLLHDSASGLTKQNVCQSYADWWREEEIAYPTRLANAEKFDTLTKLRPEAEGFFRNKWPEVHAMHPLNSVPRYKKWDPNKKKECIEAIKEWLGSDRRS